MRLMKPFRRCCPTRLSILSLGAMGLMLAACRTGSAPGVVVDGEHAWEPESIVQMGENLHGGFFRPSNIAIDYEENFRTADDRLRVRLNIRNRTRSQIQIQVQTLFKDDEWNWIGEKVDWKLMRLGPGETKPYEATSPSEIPTRYTVRIRSFN